MYTLGYSGFDGSAEFKKNNLADLTENEYRIYQGMDAAAALLHKGQVIAAASEERFVGTTHTGQFPKHAIEYCLREAGISWDDIHAVCHGFNYSLCEDIFTLDEFSKAYYDHVYDPTLQPKLFKKHFNIDLKNRFFPIRHHDAHAASAYFMSGFDNALVLVVDGMGEMDSISIYQAYGNNLIPIQHYDVSNSLGIFYLAITLHLGFAPNHDEYKIMGLAPYGDPDRFKYFFEECIDLTYDGEIRIPVFEKNKTMMEKQTHRGVRNWISEILIPERQPDEPILQIHKDLAAGLQHILNEGIAGLLHYWQRKTKTSKLCMAGGVALNCTANGVVLKRKIFDQIFIQPAAGDDGTSLGAALYQYHAVEKQPLEKCSPYTLPFYGEQCSREAILTALQQHATSIQYEELNEDDLIDQAARYIHDGAVLGWVQGRMEFGPRALGNRSILANPCKADMRDRVNQVVKKREGFRPFAPSATLEAASHYFDIPQTLQLPHMLFTVDVKQEYRDQLPAITHCDGSARLQTVNKNEHPLYWKLLNRCAHYTGFPIVLNTSFNVKGQPIVRTPEDAINTLLATQIDVLFIDRFKVVKLQHP